MLLFLFHLWWSLGITFTAEISGDCEYPLPEMPFTEASICPGDSVVFIVHDSTGITFQWGDSLTGANRIFHEPGTYWLNVANGCEQKNYQIFISYCDQDPYIPTAFSPNDDGINDIFRARGPALEWILLEVFNRKGQQVFSGKELAAFWDGKFKGDDAPAGVYMWRISAGMLSGRKYAAKGEVVLVR
ncbi:MAG: gliding motility-associated C-terminal domain-containing protein [Bacteroidia bacterium]|nr:gliding motility-associated C-terminal domain-containing protein [Bacteroidia bacterium]